MNLSRPGCAIKVCHLCMILLTLLLMCLIPLQSESLSSTLMKACIRIAVLGCQTNKQTNKLGGMRCLSQGEPLLVCPSSTNFWRPITRIPLKNGKVNLPCMNGPESHPFAPRSELFSEPRFKPRPDSADWVLFCNRRSTGNKQTQPNYKTSFILLLEQPLAKSNFYCLTPISFNLKQARWFSKGLVCVTVFLEKSTFTFHPYRCL